MSQAATVPFRAKEEAQSQISALSKCLKSQEASCVAQFFSRQDITLVVMACESLRTASSGCGEPVGPCSVYSGKLNARLEKCSVLDEIAKCGHKQQVDHGSIGNIGRSILESRTA
jgi:hypothetical protein